MFDSGNLRYAYLGKHAQDLVLLSSRQVGEVYAERGLIIPVEVSSTLQYIGRHAPCTAADIGRALNLPHQLVAQRLRKLAALNCVRRRPDARDARRTHLLLTARGRQQHQLLVQAMEDTARVYRELYEEIGCDLAEMLNAAIDALNRRPLPQRFADTFKTQGKPA